MTEGRVGVVDAELPAGAAEKEQAVEEAVEDVDADAVAVTVARHKAYRMETNGYPIKKLSLWSGLVLAIALIALSLFALSLKTISQDAQTHASLESDAVSFADDGVYNDTRIRTALASLSPDDPNYVRAHIIYSSSQFLMGGREERLEAVGLVKDRYRYAVEHNLLDQQAYALNQLVRYAVIAFDRKITEEIFKEEFAALYDSKDIPASLARLSQKSIALYPTSDGYLAYASSIAEVIIQDHVGAVALSDTDRATIRDTVSQAIVNADALFERDASSNVYQFFGTEYPVMHNFMRGKLYGTLSLVDPAYIQPMDESFDAALNASRGSEARLFVDGTLPYLYLTRALITLAVAPTKQDVIRASAAAVANSVHANPEATAFFMQYLRGIGRTPELGGLLTRDAAQALAELDAGFKSLLKEAGWKLDA